MQCASAGGIPGGRGQSNQKRKDVLFMSDSVDAAEEQKLSLAPFLFQWKVPSKNLSLHTVTFFFCLVSSPLAHGSQIMRFYATVTPVSCGCKMEKLIMASVQCFDQLK